MDLLSRIVNFQIFLCWYVVTLASVLVHTKAIASDTWGSTCSVALGAFVAGKTIETVAQVFLNSGKPAQGEDS